ncbi:transcription/translation regulatory transformer protein RfaH [Thiomicrorhabdus aquaedulcis]|uniref:transcription/translation regulatory transformer protein RfaH n=1 Tax=Thiomicrorhabdus aquaedulcis TaxID=2211106 RepID=UPI000FD87924|nr:transcription/translation regulatory transformer protein RfaH [Thiomicrorhabdus aquaedulcis]
MSDWSVIMTKPKQDAVAEEHLMRQGYHVYRPKIKVQKTQRGKVVECLESLFPRYLFIQITSQNPNWAPIRSTKGVFKLVSFGNRLATINARLIDVIQQTENATSHDYFGQGFDLKAGDKLRVESGPFYGLEAVFDCYDAKKRVVMLMSILGQMQKVVLDASQIQKLE